MDIALDIHVLEHPLDRLRGFPKRFLGRLLQPGADKGLGEVDAVLKGVAITIPISQYRAQKKVWGALLEAVKDGDGRKLNIEVRDKVAVISVNGEDKKAVGPLKVRVESIVAGEKLGRWHLSLSQKLADCVFQDTGTFLRIDCRLRAWKMFGKPDSIAAARALVDTELAHLESLEQTVFLERRYVQFFVTRWLAMLKEERGDDNAILDISSIPAKVIIKGGEVAMHILFRVLKKSLVPSKAVRKVARGTTCPICSDAIPRGAILIDHSSMSARDPECPRPLHLRS